MSRQKTSGNNHSSFFNFHSFSIALVIISVLSLMTRVYGHFNGDVSWLLYSTNNWLNGAKLYVDIIEVNPPLVFFIYSIPVFISQITGINYMIAFTAFTYILIFFSLLYSFRIFTRYLHLDKNMVAILIVSIYFSLTLLSGDAFGQREHLLVILSLPYILLTALRLEQKHVPLFHAAAVGMIATFGFALKPYFIFIPISLEFLLILKYKSILKSFRPETIIMGLLMILYLVVIVIYTPEYISHIFKIAQEIYSYGYKKPLLYILISSFSLLAVTGIFLFLISTKRSLENTLLNVFSASLVGYWLSFLIQQKGWYYHIYPVIVTLLILTVLWFYPISIRQKLRMFKNDELDLNGKLSVYFFIYCILSLFMASWKEVREQTFQKYFTSEQVAAYKPIYQKKTGQELKTVYVLGFYMSQGFPMVTETNVRWASRFPSQWLLRGLLKKRDIEGSSQSDQSSILNWIEHYNIESVTADLIKFKPGLIIAEAENMRDSKKGPYKFSLIKYFKKDAKFKKIWSKYQLTKSTKLYDFYTRTNN